MSKTSPQENLGKLKFAVVFMGILLVFGTMALFVAVYIKFQKKSSIPVNTSAVVQAMPVQQAPAPEVKTCDFQPDANIELSGRVTNAIRSGNTLTIITEKEVKPAVVNKVQEGNSLTLTAEAPVQVPQQIILFDLCEGVVLSSLNVTRPQ